MLHYLKGQPRDYSASKQMALCNINKCAGNPTKAVIKSRHLKYKALVITFTFNYTGIKVTLKAKYFLLINFML